MLIFCKNTISLHACLWFGGHLLEKFVVPGFTYRLSTADTIYYIYIAGNLCGRVKWNRQNTLIFYMDGLSCMTVCEPQTIGYSSFHLTNILYVIMYILSCIWLYVRVRCPLCCVQHLHEPIMLLIIAITKVNQSADQSLVQWSLCYSIWKCKTPARTDNKMATQL